MEPVGWPLLAIMCTSTGAQASRETAQWIYDKLTDLKSDSNNKEQ